MSQYHLLNKNIILIRNNFLKIYINLVSLYNLDQKGLRKNNEMKRNAALLIKMQPRVSKFCYQKENVQVRQSGS